MPKFRNYQTNFSGGLLSEGLLGRVDLAQYENGCKQLTNWWPKVTGGMRRRPGSLFLVEPPFALRIESFIFSETQTYLIAFAYNPLDSADSKVLIYNEDDGTLIDSVTVSFGWSADIIKEMSITQKGDVMFLAHEDWVMKKLTRTSATTFTLGDFEFEGVAPNDAYPKKLPFVKYADADITISVNNYTVGSTVTVTASAAVFTSRHIGRAIRYRGKQLYVDSIGVGDPSLTCICTILEELDRGCTLGFNATLDVPTDFLIDEIVVGRDSGIKAQVIDTSTSAVVLAQLAGIFPTGATEEIEGLTSGNICTITSDATTNPVASFDWDEEAFSPTQGYPSVIEFHSQRLWLGGSSSLPAHIFGSRVAAFFNFDVGDAFPADSIQVAISGNQINLITDIVSGRHLQVFTDNGEFYAPEGADSPLVPDSFDVLKQTRYGSQRNIGAWVFDESTIFAQAQGNAVREFVWKDTSRGYSADAISLISEEFLNDIQEIEVLYGGYDRPEQIAFFVNGDGSIAWYHAARAEQIRTWGVWETQGDYKSLTVIQDKLYGLVERNIDGVDTMMIERFELDITLDCVGRGTSVSAKSLWVGEFPHLIGEDVQVTSSIVTANHDPDYYLGEFTVPGGGTIELSPIEVDNVSVGLGFTQTLETMPIEVQDANGLTGGMPKRLVSADLYIASTLAVQLEGNRITTFDSGDLSLPPLAVTGLRKFYLLGYDERPTLLVENEVPLPCEILSLGAEVEY